MHPPAFRRIMFRCTGQRKGVVCLWQYNYGRNVVAVFQARRRLRKAFAETINSKYKELCDAVMQ